MDIQDVRDKLKRKNQILFNRKSQCLQELLAMLEEANHRASVLWAFECVQESLETLQKHYPDEKRPANAVALTQIWAQGEIKMPVAKAAILEVHAMAKELKDPADIALCHGIGQACGTVHAKTHAPGLPFYELTAIVRKLGIDNCEAALAERIKFYMDTLRSCEQRERTETFRWAAFLQ